MAPSGTARGRRHVPGPVHVRGFGPPSRTSREVRAAPARVSESAFGVRPSEPFRSADGCPSPDPCPPAVSSRSGRRDARVAAAVPEVRLQGLVPGGSPGGRSRRQLPWDSALRGMSTAAAAPVSRRGAPAACTRPARRGPDRACGGDRSPPDVAASLDAAGLHGLSCLSPASASEPPGATLDHGFSSPGSLLPEFPGSSGRPWATGVRQGRVVGTPPMRRPTMRNSLFRDRGERARF